MIHESDAADLTAATWAAFQATKPLINYIGDDTGGRLVVKSSDGVVVFEGGDCTVVFDAPPENSASAATVNKNAVPRGGSNRMIQAKFAWLNHHLLRSDLMGVAHLGGAPGCQAYAIAELADPFWAENEALLPDVGSPFHRYLTRWFKLQQASNDAADAAKEEERSFRQSAVDLARGITSTYWGAEFIRDGFATLAPTHAAAKVARERLDAFVRKQFNP
jgi:hypothetical protein